MDKVTVTIPVELLEDLIEVCRWYQTACNLSRNGETYELCPDQQAFDYLESEAITTKLLAEQYLPKAVQS